MKILFAASEMEPFAGSDAFGGTVAATAAALVAEGHEVSVVMPYFRSVRERGPGKAKKTGVKFSVPLGGGRCACEIREGRAPGGVQMFFVERDEFFDRSGLYGVDERDYQDNAARFVFFSKAVVELVRRMEPAPDIIHAWNWQAALVPVLAADSRLGVPVVLGVQSLAYQGNFWSYDFGLTNLPGNYFSARGLEFYGSMNLLKGGILFANSVVLPGPRFVTEVQQSAYGCGMEVVLRENAGKLDGVPPGMNMSAWNPASDKALPKRYKTAESRAASRKAVWQKFGFTPGATGPALVLRTDAMIEDGLVFALEAFDRLAECGTQLLILGHGQPGQAEALEFATRKHRGALVRIAECGEETWRRAIASADAMLLPAPVLPDASRLIQAARYGCPPVAVACGGLQEIVPPVSGSGLEGFGFFCHQPTTDGIIDSVRAMDAVRRQETVWNGLVARAMQTDASWTKGAHRLSALYQALISHGGRLAA